MSWFAPRQPFATAISIGVAALTIAVPLSAAQSPSTLNLNMPKSSLRLVQQELEYTRYMDAETGTAITYPRSVFTKSDESTDQFTKFVSSDRLATFYLVSTHNHHKQTIPDLSAAAEEAFAEEKALITYRREKMDWFVLSGFVADNIFYRKTVLSNSGQIIATFQINFPKEQKPFYYKIVERMSWSFKPQ